MATPADSGVDSPVAVRDFPSRQELLDQLETRWAARREAIEVPVWKRPTDFNKRIEIKIENWRDVPGTTLARDSFLPLSADPILTRFATIGLLCELAVIHNAQGEWPKSLDSIDTDLIPRDPFTDGDPLHYELRYDHGQYVPYIWSIGADKVSQNGDRLRAHASGLDDWRIVPVHYFPLVEKR